MAVNRTWHGRSSILDVPCTAEDVHGDPTTESGKCLYRFTFFCEPGQKGGLECEPLEPSITLDDADHCPQCGAPAPDLRDVERYLEAMGEP